jgi:hypothetical protein
LQLGLAAAADGTADLAVAVENCVKTLASRSQRVARLAFGLVKVGQAQIPLLELVHRGNQPLFLERPLTIKPTAEGLVMGGKARLLVQVAQVVKVERAVVGLLEV